jgi:hypothetical protein
VIREPVLSPYVGWGSRGWGWGMGWGWRIH